MATEIVRPQYLQVAPGTVGHLKAANNESDIRGGMFTAAGIEGVAFNASGARVTGLAASPQSATDAAPKGYVDSLAMGFQLKDPCRVTTTAAINLSAPGATIDGVSMSVDNRVLVKNQATSYDNGIYLWKGASLPMVRAPDAPAGSTTALRPGALVSVTEGTANADSIWVITSDTPITIGNVASGAMTWTLFTSISSSISAGAGLDKAVNEIYVVAGDGIEVTSNNQAVNVDVDGTSVVLTGTSPNKKVAVGVINDTQHGVRSGGNLHAVATQSLAGFMSADDKTRLDNMADGSQPGTVTSVGLSMPAAVFNVSGSPVTESGTLSVTFGSQSANQIFAGPVNGSAAPTFRALVSGDLPSVIDSDTTGTAARLEHSLYFDPNDGTGAAATFDGSEPVSVTPSTLKVVPTARTVAAGAGLSGGGGLASDITLSAKVLASGGIVADASNGLWIRLADSTLECDASGLRTKGLPLEFTIDSAPTSPTVTADVLNALCMLGDSPADEYHQHGAVIYSVGGYAYEDIPYGTPVSIWSDYQMHPALAIPPDENEDYGYVVGLAWTYDAGTIYEDTADPKVLRIGRMDLSGTNLLTSFSVGDVVFLGPMGGFSKIGDLTAGSRMIRLGKVLSGNVLAVDIQDMGEIPAS
jgi:hypothetical protein